MQFLAAIIVPKLQRERPSIQLLLAATPCGLPQESTVTLSHQHGPKVSNSCCKKKWKFLENKKWSSKFESKMRPATCSYLEYLVKIRRHNGRWISRYHPGKFIRKVADIQLIRDSGHKGCRNSLLGQISPICSLWSKA